MKSLDMVSVNERSVLMLERIAVTNGRAHIDEFVIAGRHEDWRLGARMTISLPEGQVSGRLITRQIDPRNAITTFHIFYRE